MIETTNHDCPYVGKHYRSGNMQSQQRDAAAKGVVWLTVASSAPGEQGYVTASEANEIVAKNGTQRRPPCCSIRKAGSRAPTAPP